MVGCTLAIAAARGGLSSILADRLALSAQVQAGFDGRSSAIARGSQQVLAGIGLWQMVADDAEAIQEIRVSDGRPGASAGLAWASPLFLHYDSAVLDGAPLGYIVENRVLRQACATKVSGLAEITYCAPGSLAALERQGGAVTAMLEDGRSLRASLVVSAEGRFSSLREAAGIATRRWDYPQAAIVCSVGHELPHGGVAHEHFLPSGPFAMLPMTDGADGGDRRGGDRRGGDRRGGKSGKSDARVHRSSIVWTERQALVPAMMALDGPAFSGEIQRRFGDSLGALRAIGGRWAYPLSLIHAGRYVDHRLALVGDAAHSIHPIAGQGLNLGLRDVAALAETLVDARRLGLDLGAADVLARYQRWRRFDNLMLIAATDSLNRLFSNDLGPLRLARDLGLAAVNRMPPLKKLFMRHAMGLVGDLPRLIRGEAL